MHYLAFVQRDESGGYFATLPDFPGCQASAPSWLQLEDAIRGAVRVHVSNRTEPVPPPTPIELLTEDSAPPDSCWMQVALFSHEVRPARRRAREARASAMLESRARL
ncbi:MAG: type II toxin-antitoxin system HicB family antitoxin [Pseudomonadota bacterium]